MAWLCEWQMTTGINLLPWRKESRLKKERCFRKKAIVVFGFVIFFLMLWHFILWRQINVIEKQIDHIQQNLRLLEKKAPIKNNAKHQQQQQVINRITNLEQERIGFVSFFEKLHQGVVANTQLTQLMIKNNDIKIFGKASSMFGVVELLKIFSKNNAKPVLQKITRQDDDYDFVMLLCFY